MKSKIPSLCARFLLCLSISLLALLSALQVTLFNESYLLHTLETTNYYSNVAHTARTVFESFFSQAQFGVGMVGQYISEETVSSDIQSAIYNRFRNAGIKTVARFSSLATDLSDTVYNETGVVSSENDLTRYSALQATCEGSYQTIVSVPFDAALSIVLQYRSLRTILYPSLGILIFLSLLSLFKLSKDMKEFFDHLFRAFVPAGFACVLGGLTFVLFSGFQNWMPVDNIAHTAFTRWLGGLFPYFSIFGVFIGVSGLAIDVFLVKQIHHKGRISNADTVTTSVVTQANTPRPVSSAPVPPAQPAQTQPPVPSAHTAMAASSDAPSQNPQIQLQIPASSVPLTDASQAQTQPAATQKKHSLDTMTISFPAQNIPNAAPTERNIRLP